MFDFSLCSGSAIGLMAAGNTSGKSEWVKTPIERPASTDLTQVATVINCRFKLILDPWLVHVLLSFFFISVDTQCDCALSSFSILKSWNRKYEMSLSLKIQHRTKCHSRKCLESIFLIRGWCMIFETALISESNISRNHPTARTLN